MDDTTSTSVRETDGMVIREEKPGKGDGKREKRDIDRDLTVRLNHLRAEARQACEAYLANVDSDVSTLVEFLNGGPDVTRPRSRKAATLDGWMKTLDRTSIKPHKGRAKDLRRIDRAIRSMLETAFD